MSYQERMLHEQDELCGRIQKLKAYLDGDQYQGLPLRKQRLLVMQYNAMETYSSILQMRIEEEFFLIEHAPCGGRLALTIKKPTPGMAILTEDIYIPAKVGYKHPKPGDRMELYCEGCKRMALGNEWVVFKEG